MGSSFHAQGHTDGIAVYAACAPRGGQREDSSARPQTRTEEQGEYKWQKK